MAEYNRGKPAHPKVKKILDENRHTFTREDKVKGQIASQAAQKRRRTAQEIAAQILNANFTPETMKDCPAALAAAQSAAAAGGCTWYHVIMAAQAQQAAAGSTAAAQFVRDSVGDKPTEKAEISADITPGDVELLQKVAKRLQNQR